MTARDTGNKLAFRSPAAFARLRRGVDFLVARGRGDIAVFDEIIESYRATGLIP